MIKIHKNTKKFLIILSSLFFLGLFLQFIFPLKSPVVANFIPVETNNVPLKTNILITFKSVIPKSLKKKIKITISPDVNSTNKWLDNNYQYSIKPSNKFLKNTNYTVEITFAKKSIFKQSFKTAEFSQEEQMLQASEQGKLDIKFNKTMKKIKLDYPWYGKVPIITDQFIIVYDYEKNSFRIRLFIPKESDDKLKKDFQLKALEAMEKVEININNWKYYFLYQNS